MERRVPPEQSRQDAPIVPSPRVRMDDSLTTEGRDIDKTKDAPTKLRAQYGDKYDQDTITFVDDDGNSYIWPYKLCRTFEVRPIPAIRPAQR